MSMEPTKLQEDKVQHDIAEILTSKKSILILFGNTPNLLESSLTILS